MYPRAPEIDRRRSPGDTARRPREQFWKELFNRMMEIDNELPAHYVTNEWQPKLTHIDRAFVSLPSWQTLQHHICAATPEYPE
eukprot:2741264-Pyramimonas_sp.AAC.1